MTNEVAQKNPSQEDSLNTEIVSYLTNGADDDQIVELIVGKIVDYFHFNAKLPTAMTTVGDFGAHKSFMKMVEALPERKQELMKGALFSMAAYDLILSDALYEALEIKETTKNPRGTNLVSRGKLTTREAYAVLSRTEKGDFFGALYPGTDEEFDDAIAKISASSFASAVRNRVVRSSLEKDNGPSL
jgi:hypothetical protein